MDKKILDAHKGNVAIYCRVGRLPDEPKTLEEQIRELQKPIQRKIIGTKYIPNRKRRRI